MLTKISIIIPVFNGGEFVVDCIKKIQQQTYRNIEVVFVDDCSEDNTCEAILSVIKDDPRFSLVQRDEHTDPFQCRKAGFLASSGDIIVFLDADDTLIPEACSTIVDVFKKNKVDMFIYGSLASCGKNITEDSLAVTQKYLDKHLDVNKKRFCISDYKFLLSPNLWPVAVWNKAIKRKVLEKAFSLYDPKTNLSYAQDILQTLLTFLSCHSIYANTDLKLHRYSLGTGATDKTNEGLSWEKFVRVSGAAKTTKAIEELVDIYSSKFGNCAEKIKEKFVADIFSNTTKYLFYLPLEKIPEGIDYMYSQWGPMLFASSSFSAFEFDKYKKEILCAKCLENKKTEIKNVVLYYHQLGFGGIQTCLRLLTKIFGAAGFDPFVVTDFPIDDKEKEGFAENTRFISLAFCPNKDKDISKEFRSKRWSTIIKDNKIDVVYYSSYENKSMVNDILTIRSQQAYTVVHMHSVFSSTIALGYPHVLRRSIIGYNLSDALVTLSRENQFFFDSLGANAHYIPNPPTFSKELATGQRTKPVSKRIIWCGRIAPGKQLLDGIKIFARAKYEIPDLKMTILGDSIPIYNEIKTKAISLSKKLKCNNSIEWVGFVRDVHSYFAKSDIMLSTSLVEGFPMTFLEAYSMGVPIVLYKLPCVETAKTPYAAHVVPQLDCEQAANKIVQLLTDEELYSKSSAVAYDEYLKFANYDYVETWKNLFLSLPNCDQKSRNLDNSLISEVLSTIVVHSASGIKMANDKIHKELFVKAFIVRCAIKVQVVVNKIVQRFFKNEA